MRRSAIFTLFLLLSIAPFSFSQSSVPADSTLFDFWVGEWDLTWTDPDGTTAKGKNIITKILDGAVIHENFTALSGASAGFKGESFSLLDRPTSTWKQTWVDNQSTYLPFNGGRDGAVRYFEREFERNGKRIKQKMMFRNITATSFDWDWMNSTDGGTTWNNAWTIRYRRATP